MSEIDPVEYVEPDVYYREGMKDEWLEQLANQVNEMHTVALGHENEDGEWEYPAGKALPEALDRILMLINVEKEILEET